MSTDPIQRLAKQRIIKLSADLEVQIATVKGGGPTVEIFRRLQDRAAESLAALAFVDITKVADVIKLQNEVKRYDEWIGWMKDILAEGKIYDRQFTEDDRAEMLEYLLGSPEGERQAIDLGLIDSGPRDPGVDRR
jgi:hypothetical protein